MQKKRSFILVFLALILVLSFGAANAQEPSHFAGAWPYQVPPSGHLNMFATGRIDLGIWYYLRFPPFAIYHWATSEYEGELAESFGYDEDNNYVITLKPGIMWSDGTPLTSQDVVTTFNIYYALGDAAWQSMSKVEAVDDLTVKFTVTAPSNSLERQILTQHTQPHSVYGEFAERAQALVDGGLAAGDADFDTFVTDITGFRPETEVSVGPYTLDISSVNDANATMVKNAGGWNADVAAFDEILVWNGETETVTPLVANGDLWYATHGFPPATEASFIDAGIDIIRGPGYTGPGIYFNHSIEPLNVPEVRQAMAYVIDRNQNGFVSLADSGVAIEYMSGISDALADSSLSPDVIDSLNPYEQDLDMATSLLEGVGWTKDDAGHWLDASGNAAAWELKFPAEFADWSAAAENAVQQLNDFGFQITGVAVQFEQQLQDVYDSNFQLAIRGWGSANPFAGFSYQYPYITLNGQGALAGEEVGGGMRFDPNVTYTNPMGCLTAKAFVNTMKPASQDSCTLNVQDASIAAAQGLDAAAQQAQLDQLAVSYNQLLPFIQLWERHGNNPLNRTFVNAPAADDPIYINPWSGFDAFIPYLIATGVITPASA